MYLPLNDFVYATVVVTAFSDNNFIFCRRCCKGRKKQNISKNGKNRRTKYVQCSSMYHVVAFFFRHFSQFLGPQMW